MTMADEDVNFVHAYDVDDHDVFLKLKLGQSSKMIFECLVEIWNLKLGRGFEIEDFEPNFGLLYLWQCFEFTF